MLGAAAVHSVNGIHVAVAGLTCRNQHVGHGRQKVGDVVGDKATT